LSVPVLVIAWKDFDLLYLEHEVKLCSLTYSHTVLCFCGYIELANAIIGVIVGIVVF